MISSQPEVVCVLPGVQRRRLGRLLETFPTPRLGVHFDCGHRLSNWSLLFIHISCFAIRKEELIKILQMMHLEKGHPSIMIAFPYLFDVSLLCMCVCVMPLKTLWSAQTHPWWWDVLESVQRMWWKYHGAVFRCSLMDRTWPTFLSHLFKRSASRPLQLTGSLGEPRWAPLPTSLPASHQGLKVTGWKHVIMLPQELVLPGDH